MLIGGTGGQNSLPNIGRVLSNLGITAGTSGGHQNHFHVYLRPPQALDIGGHALHAEVTPTTEPAIDAAIQPEETLVFDMLIPPEPMDQTVQVIAPASGASQPAPVATPKRSGFDSVLTTCQDMEYLYPDSAANSFSPFSLQLLRRVGSPVDGLSPEWLKTLNPKITLLEAPKHGQISVVSESTYHYNYAPQKGYEGTDRIAYLVEARGKRFKTVLNILVMPLVSEEYKYCADIKFSASQLRFEQLSGTAVGEALGEGQNATIVLDLDAAGHGWFVDSTPDDNTEFLPTADPNVWKARPGSAAEGKMDLLSVLLHEYGHALGLEHSADAHDAMAATLHPGVRRLPSADELALMSQLVAQLKEQAESDSAPHDHVPLNDAPHDSPLLPTQRNTGQRLSRSRSSTTGSGDRDYLGAVNPTLANGDFGEADGTAGWVAEGEVQVHGKGVTLNESATRQTHLAHGFMVNAGDRLLPSHLPPTPCRAMRPAPATPSKPRSMMASHSTSPRPD